MRKIYSFLFCFFSFVVVFSVLSLRFNNVNTDNYVFDTEEYLRSSIVSISNIPKFNMSVVDKWEYKSFKSFSSVPFGDEPKDAPTFWYIRRCGTFIIDNIKAFFNTLLSNIGIIFVNVFSMWHNIIIRPLCAVFVFIVDFFEYLYISCRSLFYFNGGLVS